MLGQHLLNSDDEYIVKFQVPGTRGRGNHHPIMWGAVVTIKPPRKLKAVIKEFIPDIAKALERKLGKKKRVKTIELCLVVNTYSWEEKND